MIRSKGLILCKCIYVCSSYNIIRISDKNYLPLQTTRYLMLINYKKSVIRQRKPSEESRSRKKRKALLNCVSTVFSEIERRSAISLYDKCS